MPWVISRTYPGGDSPHATPAPTPDLEEAGAAIFNTRLETTDNLGCYLLALPPAPYRVHLLQAARALATIEYTDSEL